MKCVRDIKCPIQRDCAVVGCVLSNPLIIDEAEQIKKQTNDIEPKYKHKFIIDVLQEKQPPKVRKSHISRYWGAKYLEGIDLDKDRVTKKRRKYHTHTKHVSIKKPYQIITKSVKVKEQPRKNEKKKDLEREQCIRAAHYVNYIGVDCPCVGFIDRAYSNSGVAGVRKYQNAYYHSGEQKYVFEVLGGVLAYPKEKIEKFIKPFFPTDNKTGSKTDEINKEYLLYLQNQTPEQFILAKKFGWKFAKQFTAPAENFHYL